MRNALLALTLVTLAGCPPPPPMPPASSTGGPPPGQWSPPPGPYASPSPPPPWNGAPQAPGLQQPVPPPQTATPFPWPAGWVAPPLPPPIAWGALPTIPGLPAWPSPMPDATPSPAPSPTPSPTPKASPSPSPASGYDAGQQCVDTINRYRATKGLGPLSRWVEGEPCAAGQAATDSRTQKAHGSFGSCQEHAQNACPNWPGPADQMIDRCLQAMWNEGPGQGSAHGHYNNMVDTRSTKVACGTFTMENGMLWAVQDFR